VVERYDDFYEGPVSIKNIAFQLYLGYPMTLYENDEIDIAAVASSDEERVLDPTNPLNAELVTGIYADTFYVGMNVTQPPFDDPKVREAFALAIDTAKLVEVSLNEHAEQAGGYIPEGIPGFDGSLEPLPYDVDRALELISESSYGSVSNLPTITFSTIYGLAPLQEAVIGMWQQNLGVQIIVETVIEIETWMDGLRNNDYQLFTSGWVADYADPQNFLEILFQTGSSENSFGYSNPEVDSALAEAAAETNEATRIQMYRDIEQMILDDLPAIPLYRNEFQYMLVKPRIQGYVLMPISINLWRDLEIID
jgi:oligopeptide transport system substrate-binding protein